MAGTNPRFEADLFREKIRFVWNMAKPPETNQQITFHFADTVSFTGPSDGDQVPFDPNAPVTRTAPPAIQRPCSIEFKPASENATAFGVIIPTKLKVKLLDQDYQDVHEATFVMVGGDKYIRDYEEPASGLFDVGIHTIVFTAENER